MTKEIVVNYRNEQERQRGQRNTDLLWLSSAVTLTAIMASCSPEGKINPAPTIGPTPTPIVEVTPGIESASGSLVEANPSVLNDFWTKATESKALDSQISAGLTEQEVGTFTIKVTSGNLERDVNTGWFVDPTTKQERLFIQNQNGNWIEHIKNVVDNTVQWVSPLSGNVSEQPVPFMVTPAPGEAIASPEVTFYYVVDASGNWVAYFRPVKSIFGDAFIASLSPDKDIPLKASTNSPIGNLINFKSPPEATPTQEVESGVLVSHKEVIETVYGGVPVNVQIITDKHLLDSNPSMTIEKITSNSDPKFKTRYGETAQEAIAHATLYALFMRAQVKGFTGNFDSFLSILRNVGAGKRDPNDAKISVIQPNGGEEFFNAADPTKKINIIYYNQNYYAGTSNTMPNWQSGEGSIVDENGNLNIYVAGYPLVAALTHGKVIGSNASDTLNVAFFLFKMGYHGGRFPMTIMEKLLPSARFNSELFRILTSESNPPKGFSDLYTGWDWVPPKWYNSAIEIFPNDESSIFNPTPTATP